MISLTIDGRSERRVRKLLDSLSDRELQNRTRRGTRKGTAIWRKQIRARAGSRGIPRRFKKTATKGHRTPVGTSVGPTSPLHNIFEGGAGTHTIAPRAGLLLSGPVGERGRRRAFVASHPVSHPGLAARPLTGPIFEEYNDEAAEAAMEEILRDLR